MGVKELTDLAIDPATGDYVYTSLKLSDGLTALPKGYTKLNTLDLSNNKLGDVAELDGLAEIASLTDLNLASNGLGALTLPSLPVLQQLTLASNLLVNPPPLSSLPSLTSLDLSSNKISEFSDGSLGQAAKLTKLVLRGNALTSTKGIGACSSLRTLDVGANQLTSLDDLSTLVALATLTVSSNQLASLAGVESLPSLTTLDAGANQLADVAAAAALASVETLRAITIAGGGGDDEGAPPPNPLCDADNLKVELLALRPTLVTVDGEALLNAEKEEASALRAERAAAAAAEAAEEAGAAAE